MAPSPSFRWQTRIQAIATPQISSFSAQKVFTAPLWPARSPCSTDTSPLDVVCQQYLHHHADRDGRRADILAHALGDRPGFAQVLQRGDHREHGGFCRTPMCIKLKVTSNSCGIMTV